MSRVDNIINGVKKSGTTKKKSRVESIVESSSNGNLKTGVDGNYIQSFISDTNDFFSSINDNYKDIGYNNASSYYDDYTSKSGELINRANTIKAHLNSNKSKYDEKTYSDLMSIINETERTRNSTWNQLRSISQYYSQWDTEEDYNNHLIGWLEDDAEVSEDMIAKRRERYQSNADRIAEIEAEIDAYEPTTEKREDETFFERIGRYLSGASDTTLPGESELQQLKAEMDALKAENRRYKREQKVLDDFFVPETEEFLKNAAYRDYGNPTKQDIEAYAIANGNMEALIAEGAYLLRDGWHDKDGNLIDINHDAQEPVVSDKLGFYLDNLNDTESVHSDYAYNFMTQAMFEGKRGSWEELKEQEKNIYYNLLKSEGQEEAYRFLDAMQTTLNKRATQAMAEDVSDAPVLEQIFYNVASIPANILGGATAFVDDAINIVQGKDINPYSSAHRMQNFAQAVRQDTAQDINKLTGNVALPYVGTTFGDVYQALMSGADSLVGIGLGGSAFGVLMGMGAASSEAKELYEKGASMGQIAAGGILAGAAEMVFEKVSIDHFVKMGDTKSLKTFIVNTLKQGGIEASEEMLTEISNTLTDAVVMGTQSDLQGYVDQYVSQGYSESEAIVKALFNDVASNVINAGIGGLISGGAMGSLGSLGSYANYQGQVKKHGQSVIDAGGVDTLKALALDMAGVKGSTNAGSIGKLASKVDSKASAKNVGKLSVKIEETVGTQNTADVQTALTEKGLSKSEAKRVATLLTGNEALTEEQQAELEGNEKVAEVVKELVNNSKSTLNQRKLNLLAARLGVDTKNSVINAKSTTVGDVSLKNEVDVSEKVSKEGKTIKVSTGEAITINKNDAIAKTKVVDGERIVYYNTDHGLVEATDVTYASEEEGLLFEAFTDMNPAFANAVIKNYDSSVPAQTYIDGMREGIVLYGMHNFQAVGKDISRNSDLAALSEADQSFALKLGRAYAKANVIKSDNALKTAIKNAAEKAEVEGKTTTTSGKKGGIRFENGVRAKTVAQKRAVSLAKHLSRAIGIDIVFYDAMTTKNKKGEEANGYFDPKDNSIHLDLQNAVSDSKTIAFTLSHELVHFIKKWSPAKFNTFANFLMEQYAAHGVSTSTLLANKMAALGTTDADLAYEEMIADACERMLLDSNAVVKLMELRKSDLELFEKIKLHVLELLNKIRDAFKGVDPNTEEGIALQKMDDVLGKIHEMFEDAAVDAVKTYQAATLNTESVSVSEDGTIQMQMKQYQQTGRSTLLNYLKGQYGDNNANDLIATIDSIYNVMAEIKEDTALSVFGNWQDTDVELDADGHPIFTTSINNGDYELNQDFSRVCKKRRQLNFVLNMLAEDPAFEASHLTKSDFVKINKAIKEHGFEIACALCFVDSKRFRQAEWADSFANTWNDILGSMKADSKPLSRFNFATKSVNMADDGVEIDASKPISYRKWSDGKATETRHYKNLDDLLENDGNNNVKAIARLLRDNPNLRHEFRGADIIASDGFDMIQRLAPDVRGILDGWGGSSVPKPSSNDAIYDNSILNIDGYNAEKAFAVGGVRMNSFSDFMAHMFFDYAQAFADLSAKNLPMHSYTKELDFARLFGLTGGKVNMSAIAAIRSNAPNIDKIKDKTAKEAAKDFEKSIAGLDISRLAEKLGKSESEITYDDVIQNLDDVDYVWADESIDVKSATLLQTGILYDNLTEAQAAYCYELIRNGQIEEAFRVAGEKNVNRGYAKHIGIITVGVSRAHILKLLRDPTIRMVIPYHKSGLNPAVAKALNIAFYDDFTDVQNTSVKKGDKQVGITGDDARVKWKNPKNGKTENKKLKDFSFYDYFGKTVDEAFYDGKATAAKYIDWCENGVYDETVGDYVYYLSGGGYILASELHAQGVEVIPKFSEFASEENYYKLIEDFDCYDTITGEHSAQEAVDFFHDGLPSDYKDVLTRALKAEQKVHDDFKDHLDNKGLRDEIMDIVKPHGYTPSELNESLDNIMDAVGADNPAEATELYTDVENTTSIKKQKKKTSDNTYESIGKELLYYEEGDLAPDLTLVETVNDRTGNKEVTIKHYGQKPKDYIPKKIAYCYKLFEQHPDGSLHALFAGAKNAVPIGEWRYAQGFPRTDEGVSGMNLRERYGWHLSAGLPSAPHLMSSKSFERGYPSKGAYGHKKGSKRVWVRMAYDASTDFNSIADSTGNQNDIYGLIPFGGYYAFKENNQSEWVISSAVKIDKILTEEERQQILKDAGYDEYEAWRVRYQPTPEERAARELANKERAKAKAKAKRLGIDTELSESTKAMRESIKSRIIDNPELNDGIKKQAKPSKKDPRYLDPHTVTESDAAELLNNVNLGMYAEKTHIPLRIGTPPMLIYWAKKKRGDVIDNNPISMEVGKAAQAMARAGGDEQHRPHKLSVDDMISVIKKMNDPRYIVYQEGNDRYVEVIEHVTEDGRKVFAVLEIGDFKDSPYMNGFEGGIYSVLVTAFPPDAGKLNELLNHPQNKVIYDKEKDLSQVTSDSTVSSVLNDKPFYEDIIPHDSDSVKRKLSDGVKSQKKRATSSYAPTFYSQMGKVIDDIKMEKVGTASIVNFLKGKGIKNEEIKWSGIEAFLEGKKSVTKQEFQEFVAGSMLQVEEKLSGGGASITLERSQYGDDSWNIMRGGEILDTYSWSEDSELYESDMTGGGFSTKDRILAYFKEKYGSGDTRWGQYTLDGGSNYRELVFTMPKYFYSNQMMRMHWGQEAKGVLAHARIQDFVVNGKKMLFIEEIQSDYHNEGHQSGYTDSEAEAKIDELKSIADEKFFAAEDYSTEMTGYAGEWETIEKTEKGAKLLREYREARDKLDNAMNEWVKKIPDAPFRDTYHEYVLKRLLRMAAEEGYDSIGWTPAEIQDKRWDDNQYHEEGKGKSGNLIGYTIEYDQDMPKFLRKYGKRWGATVGNAVLNGNTEIWSMDITDSMKESVLYEGQPMFQKKTTTNRTLLANALESAAQNDIERNKIAQYKEKIALIESEQAKLAEVRAKANELRFTKGRTPDETKEMKSLDFEANQIANRINTYDRQLLNLESTTALKNVLQREKEQARKREAQKGKEALAAYKEKSANTQRELMNRYQESRKKGIESRSKTETRHKIKDIVSKLNSLLLDPTKDKHVPIGLQKPVAAALEIINMDTVGADERIAKYDALIAKAKDPDVIASLKQSRDRIALQGESLSDKLTALRAAYAEIKNSDDPLVKNSHNEAIEDLIANTIDKVGNTALRDMSLGQLEAVYDMYKAILATVRNANKMFKEGRQETVTDNSEAVKTEVKTVGGHRDRVLKATKFLKKFGWNMLKPIYAMKLIGSDTFTRLYENVRKGEDTWAIDVNEAKEFFQEKRKKYNYDSWDFKKQYSFEDSAGNSFSLSLEQIMSLYAYSKREQADRHLEVGGFIFDDVIEVTEKNKLGIPMKYEVNDANPYRLRREDLGAVIGILDSDLKDVKGFVDEMQAYLSDVMGAKGNEVSLAMYDIKLYNEKHYFPLKTAKYFREFDPEKNGTPKIRNSGFSKKTVPKAGNPIVLSNFMDVWAKHVNDMSMYHAFVLPLEDFMRVYNYSSTAGGYDSVQQYIKNAYGAQANTYIETLMNDLNGGARTDPATDIIGKGLSLFKKSAVFASASVVIQQPSAIARALAYIDPKYFVDKPNATKHKETWAEVKKYAPVAIIKEMGYFDTNMGRSTVDWIRDEKNLMDKIDYFASKAPALADELAWSAIWKAVKREIAATTKLKVGSEEFLEAAGKRFTEVVTNTQVYDSVLSRSALMRSKDTGAKMITAFMAEPTTSLNMVVDAIIEGKRGNKKFAGKAIGAVSASIILNSILVSLVTAARDDDDDETYTEKYLESLTAELIDGFNPLTYIPFVKDVWSIMQGYDIERSDMSIWSDLWQSVENLFSDNKSGFEKTEGIVGSIASFFGLPLKNLMRDARAMYNLATTLLSGKPTTRTGVGEAIGGAAKSFIPLYSRIEKWVGADKSKTDNLYDAVMDGDTAHVERLKSGYKDEKSLNTAIRAGLRENDSRIKEAAQARINGDISEYTRIVQEIISEGNFVQDIIVGAVNAEINAINAKADDQDEATDKEDESEKVSSIYRGSDINDAFESGNNDLAVRIIDDLIETKVANGMEEKNAKSSVRSSMTSYWKPLYIAAYKSGDDNEMRRIRYILRDSRLYGNGSDVSKTCQGWLTEKK